MSARTLSPAQRRFARRELARGIWEVLVTLLLSAGFIAGVVYLLPIAVTIGG
jgi:hypothetical protein